MKIKKLLLGHLQTNGYVISNEDKRCIIIDPGDIGKKIVNYITEEELSVAAIFITHGHFDHIGAVDYLYNLYTCDIYIHKEDVPLLRDANLNLSVFETPFSISSTIKEADEKMKIAGFDVEWMHLPGHCPGSSMIHFINEEVIFSGDVLFKDSIGRFDFPGSSKHDTQMSLQKIKELAYDVTIYPGHGEKTTLKIEQSNNPYLKS